MIRFRIWTEISWMRHLMMLFHKRTIANLLATASLHIILAIFTADDLTKRSPDV